MKVIKQGIIAGSVEVEESCSRCGSVFVYSKSDVKSDSRDGSYVVCPTPGCGAFINTNKLDSKIASERFRRLSE